MKLFGEKTELKGIIFVLIAMFASEAHAQTVVVTIPIKQMFVGNTTLRVNGDIASAASAVSGLNFDNGVLGADFLCNEEFAGSRMCRHTRTDGTDIEFLNPRAEVEFAESLSVEKPWVVRVDGTNASRPCSTIATSIGRPYANASGQFGHTLEDASDTGAPSAWVREIWKDNQLCSEVVPIACCSPGLPEISFVEEPEISNGVIGVSLAALTIAGCKIGRDGFNGLFENEG